MDSESKDTEQQVNEQTNAAESVIEGSADSTETKEEHIKQRLKDLGVSDDSPRPEKSWLSRYGNYLIVAAIFSLGAVYWLESDSGDNQNKQDVKQLASTTAAPPPNMNSHSMPNVPYNRMNRSNMMADPYRAQWLQQQAQHRAAMQKAWQQQQERRKKWQENQREQQAKAWADWQKYMKQQQQNNNQYYSRTYQAPQGSGTRQPQGYSYPGWQAPPVYQQPYSNNPYFNRR